MEVGFGYLRGDLVEGSEDVVGGDHHRLGRGARDASPGSEDLVPGDPGCYAISGEDGFDRLAASGLKDAELGEPFKRVGGCRSVLAGGGEEEVKAGFAGFEDGLALGWDTGGVVPLHQGHHGAGHVARHAGAAAFELGDEGGRKGGGDLGGGFGRGGQLGHGRHYTFAPRYWTFRPRGSLRRHFADIDHGDPPGAQLCFLTNSSMRRQASSPASFHWAKPRSKKLCGAPS